jgi:tetratricopeptide (TPR) repeat protein
MKKARVKPQKAGTVWHCVGLVCLAAVVYWTALSGDFVWDDEVQIVRNARIRSVSNIPQAFVSPFWGFAVGDQATQTNFYRPVQTTIYTLAYAIGGLSPFVYHGFSLMLHVAACIFVYLISLQLRLPAIASLLAAALFAVHPIHTEPVAWIAGVADVACGVFYLAAIWAILKFWDTSHNAWLAAASGLYFAALLSKEMALTFPLIVLAGMAVQFRRSANVVAKSLHTLLPLLGISVAYLGLRVNALGALATSHLDVAGSMLDWTSMALLLLGKYFWYSIVPYPLSAFHLVPFGLQDRIGSTLVALAGLAGAGFAVWKLRHKYPEMALGAGLFAVSLLPVFYLKGISTTTFFAERYLYIPSAAIAIAAGALAGRSRSPRVNAAILAVVVVFAFGTMWRNQVWRSSEQLYSRTLQDNPDVAQFHTNLADIYMKRNDDVSARRHLQRALESLVAGKYVQLPYEKYRAHVGLGALEARARRFQEARQHFQEALAIHPQGDWAYLYMGGVYLEADGDYARAMEHFRKAMELGPLNEVARDYMGIALLNQGNHREAIRYFQEALAINPNYQEARGHMETAARQLQ